MEHGKYVVLHRIGGYYFFIVMTKNISSYVIIKVTYDKNNTTIMIVHCTYPRAFKASESR